MILSWLTMLRTLPGGIVARIATYLLALTIGLALGNHWATQRALERELQASADRQRNNHQELIAWYSGEMKKLRVAREQQIGAEKSAFVAMEKTKADTDRVLKIARAQIAKLMEPKPNVALPIPDPGCVLTPGLRLEIDTAIAAINAHPNIGDPQAGSSGVPDEPHSANQILTCRELVSGLVNTLEHDAMLTGWVLSWQSWATEISK